MENNAGGLGGALGAATTLASGGLGPIGIIGSALSLGTKVYGAAQQTQQYETQIEQEKAAHAARSLDATKQLNDVISRQAVAMGARGMASGGSSFRQVSQTSFNKFHEDEERDQLNLSFTENALKSKITATEVGALGSLFKTGGFLAGEYFAGSTPLSGSSDFKG